MELALNVEIVFLSSCGVNAILLSSNGMKGRQTMTTSMLRDLRGAAEKLNISERSVQRIPEEVLPRVRIGRLVRFRDPDLDALIERCASKEAA